MPAQKLVLDLSIIIPAYKSKQILSQQLPVLLNWLSGWSFKTQVIIVVDGDGVEDYKASLKAFEVLIIGYEANMGKGYAIVEGFKHVTAPAVIYTDADIPFSEESILLLARTLRENISKNIWVIGDRTLPKSIYFDNIPWIRKAGSDLFLVIIKHTLGKQFADTQCGLKGFTHTAGQLVFEKSKVHRFAFDFECLYIARRLKLNVFKIPVVLRNQSPSTVRVLKDGVKLLKDVLKVIFIYKYD